MRLVHRVRELDPTGGKYGLGKITADADVKPDDWYLTCHFCDDMVMPGTLMYECCLHALRVHLIRLGWVGEQGECWFEPTLERPGQLKCRGQVTESFNYQARILDDSALANGVSRVHIISWKLPDSLLLEVFTNEGTGTLVVNDTKNLSPEEQLV